MVGRSRLAMRREDDSRDRPARLLRRNPGRARAGSALSAEPLWEMARPTRDLEMVREEDAAAMAKRNERSTGHRWRGRCRGANGESDLKSDKTEVSCDLIV